MYREILEDIILIMQNDYSGFKDKEGLDLPDYFREKLKVKEEFMSEEDFVELVKDYLIDFNDNHIHFIHRQKASEPKQEIGFKVRRFEDHLYVTSARKEENVPLGAKISALDGISIMDLKEQYKRYLNDSHAEREKWDPILLKHQNCTI